MESAANYIRTEMPYPFYAKPVKGGSGKGHRSVESDIEILLAHFLPRRDTTQKAVIRQMEKRHKKCRRYD